MVERKYYILVSVLVLAVFLAGVLYGTRRGGQGASVDGRRILYYVDPMNPAHTSQEPGLAPCGMKMEPVYADSPGGEIPPPFLPPGSVRITPQKQQLIGVRIGEVEKAPFTHTLRSLARVAIDETRIYRLNSYVDGWVQKIYNHSTGSLVKKDEVLATYYSQETLEVVKVYFNALNKWDELQKNYQMRLGDLPSSFPATLQIQVRQAEESLKNLGMGKAQIQELAQSRRLTQEIHLTAPVNSFVLVRNVSPGQRISKGDELYKLADLSRVWIVADLYENEAAFVKPGMKVRATLPHRNLDFWATVTDILPEYDKASRTMKVRLEADNPDYVLRPDIFLDVEFPVNLPATVTVPVDAIMHSGLKKTVFVERGNGYFEPRRVETGWRFGDRVEITQGLEPGERMVISGNFLVDSESRMRLAAAGFAGEVAMDPVIGVNVDESKARAAGLQVQYKDRTYFFHSEESKRQFEQHPERYLELAAKKAAAGSVAPQKKPGPGMAKCPVCSLEVNEAQAKAKGLTSEYQGETYYFCRYSCNREFDKAPERYIKGDSAGCALSKVSETSREKPAMDMDPVCGKKIGASFSVSPVPNKTYYHGNVYYFCSPDCKEVFDLDPESYLSKRLFPLAPEPAEASAPAPLDIQPTSEEPHKASTAPAIPDAQPAPPAPPAPPKRATAPGPPKVQWPPPPVIPPGDPGQEGGGSARRARPRGVTR